MNASQTAKIRDRLLDLIAWMDSVVLPVAVTIDPCPFPLADVFHVLNALCFCCLGRFADFGAVARQQLHLQRKERGKNFVAGC
jgi:hypothetical protein